MLIYRLAVSEEERKVTSARVKSLLNTYKRGVMTKQEVDRYYGEWIEVAGRLNKGAIMLDNSKAVQEPSKQREKELGDLYKLLLEMLGMYELFFKRMFKDNPDHYYRAQRKVIDVIQGEAA